MDVEEGTTCKSENELDMEQFRTATVTQTDLDLDRSGISIISDISHISETSISHVSETSYASEDISTQSYFTKSNPDDGDDSSLQDKASELYEDLDNTYKCDLPISSPNTAILLENSISLNDTFTVEEPGECVSSPQADRTFEISEPASPVLTAALEQYYKNQNFIMPDPQPLSTIFELPRKWRGAQVLFSKGGQYRQFNFTEGCWYRVEMHKVNQRKKRARKNGWKPKTHNESARYEILLEDALEKLDITLQDETLPIA